MQYQTSPRPYSAVLALHPALPWVKCQSCHSSPAFMANFWGVTFEKDDAWPRTPEPNQTASESAASCREDPGASLKNVAVENLQLTS